MTDQKTMEKATFAAGCFWGIEAGFRKIPGVTSAAVGYTGGSHDNPGYEDVCTGRTGDAEAVEVTFDPTVVSYTDLLDVFWVCHDPTTSNRQGPDVGTQYRSAIFYQSAEEKAVAGAYIQQLENAGAFTAPIVTTLEPLETFYRGEDYHQNFASHNPNQGYIVHVAKPKVEKLIHAFPDLLKGDTQ